PGPQVNHVAFRGGGGVEALEDVRIQMDAEALAPPIAAVQRTTAFEAQEQAEMIENACERRCFVTGACHCFPVRWRRWTAAGGSTRRANRWSTRLTRPSFVSRAGSATRLEAHAEDAAGNVERTPHLSTR